jgi:hypothetical protein
MWDPYPDIQGGSNGENLSRNSRKGVARSQSQIFRDKLLSHMIWDKSSI